MIKQGLKRYGLWTMVAALSLVSILASLALTWSVHAFVLHRPLDGAAVWISLVVPALIAPTMSWLVLRLVRDLDVAHEHLRTLSYSDALTGAYNRRYFMEHLNQEVERHNRYGVPFAVAVIDADDFKAINDRHGHPAGDQVLRRMAAVCRENLRQTDTFARLGGEEFGLLLPQTRAAEAAHLLERLRHEVAQLQIEVSDRTIGLTISIGLYGPECGRTDVETILRLADDALYVAKRRGKNRLVCEPALAPAAA